jgi:hypothetical protein
VDENLVDLLGVTLRLTAAERSPADALPTSMISLAARRLVASNAGSGTPPQESGSDGKIQREHEYRARIWEYVVRTCHVRGESRTEKQH